MKARLPKGMGGGPSDMNSIARQAQKMQEQMGALTEELEQTEYSATAGGNAVEAVVTGKMEVSSKMCIRDRSTGFKLSAKTVPIRLFRRMGTVNFCYIKKHVTTHMEKTAVALFFAGFQTEAQKIVNICSGEAFDRIACPIINLSLIHI